MKPFHPVRLVRQAMLRSAETVPVERVHRGWWAGATALALLASVALCVVAHRVPYFASDVVFTRFVQGLDLRMLAVPFLALNALGFPPMVDIVYGGTLLWIYGAGKRWEAIVGLFGVCFSAGLNALSKHVVGRARPSALLVHVDHDVHNPSFPAGHVLDFFMFAGFLCFLLVLYLPPSWKRHLGVALLAALMALMGLARIHSGEHWASDVVGGYVIGMASLGVCVLFYDWGRRSAHRAPASTALGVSETDILGSRRQP